MSVEIVKLLFDFGLLVLIWLIQIVVYPSFSYYQKNDLLQWHQKYTLRIGYVVMPLMIGQLCMAILEIIRKLTIFNTLILVLIVAVWLSTFLQFVPLHRKISSNTVNDDLVYQLVKRNWFRTVSWTVIFLLGLASGLLSNSFS